MSDSLGSLAPEPAPRSRLGMLVDRIRSAFGPAVESPAVEAPGFTPLDMPAEPSFTPWSAREDRGQEAGGDLAGQPARAFGEPEMPLDIAQAGMVLPQEQALLKIEQFLLSRPDDERDNILRLLDDANRSRGISEPGGPADPAERVARDWAVAWVGDKAADRILEAAAEVAIDGDWNGRDTAVLEQPFGVSGVNARDEWSRLVIQIDGSNLPVHEKAREIEGLGIPPAVGDTALMDRLGVVYGQGALNAALEIAARDVENDLEREGDLMLESHYGSPGGQERAEYDRHNIRELSRSDWFMPEPNAEYRQSFGQSADGFHHLTEISYGGGDREEDWSGPYPSLAEAHSGSEEIIDRAFYPERLIEIEQEVGGHDL